MSMPRDGLLGELRDAIDEMRIHVALIEEADKEIELLETQRELEENLEHERKFFKKYSDEQLRLIRQEIRKAHVKAFIKKRIPRIARAAAIVIALITIGMTTAVATMQSVRIMVLELLIGMEPQYSEVELRETLFVPVVVPEEWEGMYYPTYIPDGYSVIKVISSNSHSVASYTTAEGANFSFMECRENTSINYDTEDAEIEERRIHGMPAKLSVKNGTINLTWANDDSYFVLNYNGGKDEAMKIADSVSRIE